MENYDKSLFDKILDEDEKIIKVFKPNKVKFFVSVLVTVFLALIFFVIFSFLPIFVPDEEGFVLGAIYLLIPFGFFVFAEILALVLGKIYYKNVFYAYTNKRVVIRSGIFGVDYKSLDLSMIGAVDVYVSLLDKILKKDTGTIIFGSMASPMIASRGESKYRLANIVMPYETCKEIKSYIDMIKKEKNK